MVNKHAKKKPGWQQPAAETEVVKAPCNHMGVAAARFVVDEHSVGDEWVCPCGEVFVVKINAGDNQVLVQKDPS